MSAAFDQRRAFRWPFQADRRARNRRPLNYQEVERVMKLGIVGLPNVGKSTLFNRLIRSNRAITHDRPGVTRDRMEGVVRPRGGRSFVVIDTGGVTLDQHRAVVEGPAGLRGFEAEILRQTEAAIREAAVICLVTDGREGLLPLDEHLAAFARRGRCV